jgi:ABC-type antimicrobial peptide transport system permease subunit
MGAARGRVLGLVVRRGVKLAMYGLAFGMAGALASGIIVASFLYGVSVLDPMTLSGTSLLLAAVAILGSLLPAVRATRVPPITALGRE